MGESPATAADQNTYVSYVAALGDVIEENAPLLPKTNGNPDEPSSSEIKDCCGLWRWYWRHPINYIPVLLYIVSFVAVPVLSILWFMEEDITFLITGILTLSVTFHAIFKFKTYIVLRTEVDSFKQHNIEMQRENQLLNRDLNRMGVQKDALWDARTSLFHSFQRNEVNLQKFQDIEQRMEALGRGTKMGMDKLIGKIKILNELLRIRLRREEREMLFAAYNVVERRRTTKKDFGMTDFEEFKQMLPLRMKPRFMKKTDFEHVVQNKSIVNYSTFVNMMDLYCMYLVCWHYCIYWYLFVCMISNCTAQSTISPSISEESPKSDELTFNPSRSSTGMLLF